MIGLRIGRKYGKALLSIGKEDDKYREYAKELEEMERLLDKEEDAKVVLTSPRYSRDVQKKVLNSILEKLNFSDVMKNFLNLLVEKRRLTFLP
jgi:F-type H+-transporting ATPase subunit delta